MNPKATKKDNESDRDPYTVNATSSLTIESIVFRIKTRVYAHRFFCLFVPRLLIYSYQIRLFVFVSNAFIFIKFAYL